MSNVYCNHELLKEVMLDCFYETGCSNAQADDVVDSMVSTSLNGTDSHGINLFPHYHKAVQLGRVSKSPKIEFVANSDSLFKVNADHAFGHHAGVVATDEAKRRAKQHGVSAAIVNNSSHFGAAGYYAERIARAGMLGMAFCNADSLVRQPDSSERFLGTNPISIAVPIRGEAPLVLDMATSIGNWNKVRNAGRNNELLPLGIAADKNGNTTVHPEEAYALEPLGGYKGFGLGVMVDILCAALTGAPFSHEIGPMFTEELNNKRCLGQFYLVIDLEKTASTDAFEARMEGYVNAIRSLPGLIDSRPKAPGDIEKETRAQRLQTGIPISSYIFDEFLAISKSFSEAVV